MNELRHRVSTLKITPGMVVYAVGLVAAALFIGAGPAGRFLGSTLVLLLLYRVILLRWKPGLADGWSGFFMALWGTLTGLGVALGFNGSALAFAFALALVAVGPFYGTRLLLDVVK